MSFCNYKVSKVNFLRFGDFSESPVITFNYGKSAEALKDHELMSVSASPSPEGSATSIGPANDGRSKLQIVIDNIGENFLLKRDEDTNFAVAEKAFEATVELIMTRSGITKLLPGFEKEIRLKLRVLFLFKSKNPANQPPSEREIISAFEERLLNWKRGTKNTIDQNQLQIAVVKSSKGKDCAEKLSVEKRRNILAQIKSNEYEYKLLKEEVFKSVLKGKQNNVGGRIPLQENICYSICYATVSSEMDESFSVSRSFMVLGKKY